MSRPIRTRQTATAATSTPEDGGTTGESLDEIPKSTPTTQIPQPNNPAVTGYYKSLTRKNYAITWGIGICTTIFGLAVAVAAYYATQIREPILDLQNKVETIKEDVKDLSDFDEEVKKFIYSHQDKAIASPTPVLNKQ